MQSEALTPWIETAPFEVRYAETDAMGVVYYANYLVWFEVARGAFCQHYDIDYNAIERAGTPLAVVEAYCRYRAPARYGDRIVVRVRLSELKGSSMRFEYEVLNAHTRQLLAEGWTRHVWITREGKPTRCPAVILERVEALRTAPKE
ncbi:MAG: acyl-CoA thioesterase [Fimbriimonadales bacterium]|nr:acyl-CoA thioesterase [Fimbriimonadales bacterium]MDW8052652.1 thioesterase family protein [Armatimonadota bacterium]